MRQKLLTFILSILLIVSLSLACDPLAVRAAVPGLPFTEDFTDDTLQDASQTTANWSTEEHTLILDWREAQYGVFPPSLTGTAISSDAFNSRSLAVGDVDGDGDLDLMIGNQEQANRLYLNNGSSDPFDGVSGFDVGAADDLSWGVALGDLDGDGDLDLVEGNENHPNRAYLNNGTADPFNGVIGLDIGSEADKTMPVALGDVDGDGDLDMIAGNYDQPNKLYFNYGTPDPFNGMPGIVIGSTSYRTIALELGDFNGDGNLDLVEASDTQGVHLYLNNSTGDPFTGVSDMAVGGDATTSSLAMGDVDGDGDLDLVSHDYGHPSRLYLNNGTGDPFSGVSSIEIGSVSYYTQSVALADVDSDGDLDLAEGNYTELNRLYLNNGTSDPFGGVSGTALGSNTSWTLAIALADLDGDGDLDLAEANYYQPPRFYPNSGNGNPFNNAAAANIATPNARALAVGDVDGDGDPDIVSGNYYDNPHQFLNNGSDTPFTGVSAVDISSDVRYTLAVALGDVDGDGDLDLVTGNDGQTNRLYLNNGTSTPFNAVTGTDISSDADSTTAIALGDLDRDGDLDLVAANYGQTNKLYLNDGSSAPFASVTGSSISSDPFNTRALALGDMDNDGDLDVVTGEYYQANRLYLNNGTADPFDSVSGSNIGSEYETTTSIALGDVDWDGDLDLVAGNYNTWHPNRLYLNNGSASPFNSVSGTTIGTESKQTSALALGDLDNDGYLDLIVGNEGRVSNLYLNNGGADPFDGVSGYPLSSDVATNSALALADFDRDGDLDAAVSYSNTFSRWVPNGLPARVYPGVTTSDLDNDSFQTRAYAIGDLDGDGDPDLVEADLGNSRFFLNNGTSDPFTTWSFFSQFESYFDSATALGDVDRDGDLDVVMGSAGWAPRLFKNNGTASPFSGYSYIGSLEFLRNNGIALGDMDGDGDLDVVLGNNNVDGEYNEIGWVNQLVLNNGTTTPFSGVTALAITSDADITRDIAIGDVDGDGDLDVVAGNYGTTSRLYLNNGTDDPFDGVSSSIISEDVRYTWGIALADLDGDGDLDVVTANDDRPNRLYLNNGTADPFADVSGVDITADIRYSRDIVPVDYDRDGDLDLLVGNYAQVNRIYLNNGTGDPFAGVSGINLGSTEYWTMGLAAADLDGDGDVDVAEGNERNGQYNVVHFQVDPAGYNTTRGLATSLEVDGQDRDILSATLAAYMTPALNTSVTFYLSNNGGEKWYQVRPWTEFTFPTAGNDLRWRAVLTSLSPALTPRITRVEISAEIQKYIYLPLIRK